MKHKLSVLLGVLLLGFAPASSKDLFDIEMGCQTEHWVHLQKKEDMDELARYRELFHRNSSLVTAAASRKGTAKIPKTVHFIWLGPRPFPPKSVSNVRSWIAHNPDWTFKFWTDRPRPAPCNGMEIVVFKEYPFPFLGRCYSLSTNWGEKSDILRYEILFQQGGVYVDHDASCLTPFEPYHQTYEFYCGLEPPHPPFAGRCITANNALIGSRAGHPVIRQVIELVSQRWDTLAEKYPDKDGFSTTQIVMERTYMAFSDALSTSLDMASTTNIVFPASYFFAKKGLKPVLSKHLFANLWATPTPPPPFEKEMRQALVKMEKKFEKVSYTQWIIFAFNLALIGVGLCILNKKRVS